MSKPQLEQQRNRTRNPLQSTIEPVKVNEAVSLPIDEQKAVPASVGAPATEATPAFVVQPVTEEEGLAAQTAGEAPFADPTLHKEVFDIDDEVAKQEGEENTLHFGEQSVSDEVLNNDLPPDNEQSLHRGAKDERLSVSELVVEEPEKSVTTTPEFRIRAVAEASPASEPAAIEPPPFEQGETEKRAGAQDVEDTLAGKALVDGSTSLVIKATPSQEPSPAIPEVVGSPPLTEGEPVTSPDKTATTGDSKSTRRPVVEPPEPVESISILPINEASANPSVADNSHPAEPLADSSQTKPNIGLQSHPGTSEDRVSIPPSHEGKGVPQTALGQADEATETTAETLLSADIGKPSYSRLTAL